MAKKIYLSIIASIMLALSGIIGTAAEQQITNNTASQEYPVIDGNNIVWQDNRDGNWEIYMYNLSTDFTKRITTNISDQKNPSISGNHIVWHDARNSNWDIYRYS